MTEPDTTSIKETLTELYEIDPELRQYEADLPSLLLALMDKRPTITMDETFVYNLRASLLGAAQETKPVPGTQAIPSPFFWWAARLAPIGVMAVLFVMLVPDITNAPATRDNEVALESTDTTEVMPDTEPSDNADSIVMMYETGNERSLAPDSTEESVDLMMTAPEDSMTMKAPASSLVVEPPRVGDTATVTTLTLTEAGWLVVYTDDGGAFGDVLGTTYLEAGTHYDVGVSLSRPLVYPEMITVVVYTAENTTQFVAEDELIQMDPITGSVLTVTVPVVSELELGLPQ